MSVPTKEQIDKVDAMLRATGVRIVGRAADDELTRLAAENDRLEALFQRTHGVHSSWVAQAEKHRLENDRLRAERDEARAATAEVVGKIYRTLGLRALLDAGLAEWKEVKP